MNLSKHNFILLSLFLLSISISSVLVKSQPSPPPPDGYPYAKFSPSMAIIIVVLVAALFFMGFFSIYIRRCSNDGGASVRAALSMRRARLTAATRGLSSDVLETFPTFAYSTVKGLKIGKGALECAVCLNEFEDEETIRLIPKCDHVFHAECIDAWLENHVTCPVCRSDLVPKPGDQPTQLDSTTAVEQLDDNNADVSIRVDHDNDDVIADPNPVLSRNQSEKTNLPPRSKSVSRPGLFEKFKSHSTGHSLVQPGENTDRFTLRLPEQVRKQVISNALLKRSGSTVRMGGEGSARKGYRTGEGSSRGRSYKRNGSLDRIALRSDRWGFSRAPSFLSRAFSARSQKIVSETGGASTSTATGDKIPLYNIGPKSDEPGFKDTDSGRPPV
ncbi:E3 ubiquitin-protein ligase ATL6-like [Rutidosis leptorrhynchoides]|uniref:E3 ubiquitin-protein ligase ATL6-like n=1 Tax=Rutidosis leptorrhynchoides TaxID=125765 RepID=UPI003A9944FA